MTTIRELLADVAPEHVALRRAWREVVRGLRSVRRSQGIDTRLDSSTRLQRALDSTPVLPREECLTVLTDTKCDLAALARQPGDSERDRLAVAVERRLLSLLPQQVEDPVTVTIRGWPPTLPTDIRAALLEPWLTHALSTSQSRDHTIMELPPDQATKVAHVLDGLALAGERIRVITELPPGTCLPPLPRQMRHQGPPRGRRPWMSHLDDEGRWSLTPRHIAVRQASHMEGPVVIDGTCGCGGQTAALALAGHTVLAIDRDPGRLALARRNLEELGVAEKVQWLQGDLWDLLPRLL
ncbi:MAG: hypothetical protein QGG40_09535, partial [Myxococcota bacterium]|nr:hypothetical protein [Myxococcota bacterium]